MNKPTAVKAKFQCNSVTEFENNKTAKFNAVCGKEGDNADFTKYTPSGALEINIVKDAAAASFFEPGKNYYLTFEAAE